MSINFLFTTSGRMLCESLLYVEFVTSGDNPISFDSLLTLPSDFDSS